jgi:hypothetical protein
MAGKIEERVNRFAEQLEAALGPNLVSLVLYGSAARANHVDGRSDINLLLLVKDASTTALQKAASVLAAWTRTGESAPLIFSEEEWKDSADVFPMEIEDVRDAHQVLRGRDPVAGVATDRSQLREQLEREVRSKLLRLRTEYAAAAPDRKALARLMENSLSTFLVLFRATLRLKQIKPPADATELVRATAKATGLDPMPFEWALASRWGQAPAPLKAFDPVAAKYVDAVEQLARVVDAL